MNCKHWIKYSTGVVNGSINHQVNYYKDTIIHFCLRTWIDYLSVCCNLKECPNEFLFYYVICQLIKDKKWVKSSHVWIPFSLSMTYCTSPEPKDDFNGGKIKFAPLLHPYYIGYLLYMLIQLHKLLYINISWRMPRTLLHPMIINNVLI